MTSQFARLLAAAPNAFVSTDKSKRNAIKKELDKVLANIANIPALIAKSIGAALTNSVAGAVRGASRASSTAGRTGNKKKKKKKKASRGRTRRSGSRTRQPGVVGMPSRSNPTRTSIKKKSKKKKNRKKKRRRSINPRLLQISEAVYKFVSMKKDAGKWKRKICPRANAAATAGFAEAMKQTNGCSTPWYSYLTSVGWESSTMFDACQVHDFGYNCGHWHGLSKKTVDNIFYTNMIQMCWKRYCWKWLQASSRSACFRNAGIFWYAVHKFGGPNYNKGQKSAEQPKGKYPFCASSNKYSCVRKMERYIFSGYTKKYC